MIKTNINSCKAKNVKTRRKNLGLIIYTLTISNKIHLHYIKNNMNPFK
jgi:hypothetical protein